MRRAIVTVLYLTVCAVGFPAGATSTGPGTTARGTDDKRAVVISNPGGEEPGQQVPRRGRRGTGPAPPGHLVTNYHVRGGLDGTFCLYTTTVRREAPISGAEEYDNRSLRGFAAERGMPMCEGGNDPVPGRVAQAFVRTI
ncbi:MAG TPA: hypothetical protein VK988_10880, partial [Acidimicrobiales bacterium]|nr:hypothetical protein [Acidimicrobiales bacterium]